MAALQFKARHQAASGEFFDALATLLEGVRFSDDVARGGTLLTTLMLEYGLNRRLMSEMQLLLALQPKLSASQASELRRQIDVLVATIPEISDTLQAEAIYIANNVARPILESSDWNVPGTGEADPLQEVAQEEDQATATLYVQREFAEAMAEACSGGATIGTCHRRAMDWATRISTPPTVDRLPLLVLGARHFRQEILEQMLAAEGDLIDYIPQMLVGYLHLRALRAIIGFQQRVDDGECPGANGFAEADLELPELGGSLRVRELGSGWFQVEAPPELYPAGASEETALPLVFARCRQNTNGAPTAETDLQAPASEVAPSL